MLATRVEARQLEPAGADFETMIGQREIVGYFLREMADGMCD